MPTKHPKPAETHRPRLDLPLDVYRRVEEAAFAARVPVSVWLRDTIAAAVAPKKTSRKSG